MWIFSSRAFLSIVRQTEKSNVLIVRSRFKGHIERIFPKAVVTEDSTRDYRFRTEISVKEVSKSIARLVCQIDYPNFKNSLNASELDYASCCFDVYDAVLKNACDWIFNQSAHHKEEFNEG